MSHTRACACLWGNVCEPNVRVRACVLLCVCHACVCDFCGSCAFVCVCVVPRVYLCG